MFVKNYLRLYLIKHGTLDTVENKDFIKEEFEKSTYDDFKDFLYGTVGYSNDVNMSPKVRYKKRKEVMSNFTNKKYWVAEAEIFGAKRTSEVVDIFDTLDVLGAGRSTSLVRNNDFFLPRISEFISMAKPVIEVFCEGYRYAFTTLSYNGKTIPMEDIVELLRSRSTKELLLKIKKHKVPVSNLLRLVPSSTVKLVGDRLYLNRKIIQAFDADMIMKYLLVGVYAHLNKIDLQYYGILDSLDDVSNLLDLSDYSFLNLIDLGNLNNTTVLDILSVLNYTIPDLDWMIKISRGIFIYSFDGMVHYIPMSHNEPRGRSVSLDLNRFISMLNNGLLTDIKYINGVPFLKGTQLADVG